MSMSTPPRHVVLIVKTSTDLELGDNDHQTIAALCAIAQAVGRA